MAHSPIFRPASSDPHASGSVPGAGRGLEPEVVSQLARWQTILSAHGGAAVSVDLALDLVLNEIVEVTREATHAQAAAIALARDGEIVCRATTGDGAPGLGLRLSGDAGLSAACVQTGDWQRCEDSESDPRVDRELCRRLGVRSILVVPVLRAGELLGVMEIFSAEAGAFGEREVRTLQMLSRSVLENIELARMSTKVEPEVPAEIVSGSGAQPEPGPAEALPVGAGESGGAIHSSTRGETPETADFWTGALMLAVVALAVTLGWMVGRGGRQASKANVARQASPSPVTKAEVTAAAAPAIPAVTPPAPAPIPKAGSGSGLIVYQDGKMVFPRTPLADEAQARPATPAPAVRPAVATSKISAASPVRIAPEIAAGLVMQRVEPEYPQSARERQVQGAVVLDTLVGTDGVVKKFTAIRGDPELAAAASTAVRQWRFKPYEPNGKQQEFQTQVTVVFRLP
jgi:TonB family protein